jgi:exonuclease VII large subunit
VLLRDPTRRIEILEQRLDQQLARLPRAAARRWRDLCTAARHLEDVLKLSDPHLPLQRGYSMTFAAGSTKPLRSASALAAGDRIETQLTEGRVASHVEEVMPE